VYSIKHFIASKQRSITIVAIAHIMPILSIESSAVTLFAVFYRRVGAALWAFSYGLLHIITPKSRFADNKK
jgi:hypothetical protein